MATIELEPVDRIRPTILIDNLTDPLLLGTRADREARPGANLLFGIGVSPTGWSTTVER